MIVDSVREVAGRLGYFVATALSSFLLLRVLAKTSPAAALAVAGEEADDDADEGDPDSEWAKYLYSRSLKTEESWTR